MAIDLHTPLTEEQIKSLIDSLANKIAERKLENMAVLFLEMHKPLAFITSQSLLVAMPLLGPLIGTEKLTDFSKLLSKRENIELLISRIEEIAVETEKKHDTTQAAKE